MEPPLALFAVFLDLGIVRPKVAFRLQLFVGFAFNLGLLHGLESILQLMAFRLLGLITVGVGFVKRGHCDPRSPHNSAPPPRLWR